MKLKTHVATRPPTDPVVLVLCKRQVPEERVVYVEPSCRRCQQVLQRWPMLGRIVARYWGAA